MCARQLVTCLTVISSQFISWRFLRKFMSASIPFAVFHEMSLKPLRMATHSQMICTGSGGFAKARISVMSFFWSVSRAARAFSRSGNACRSASSASSCSTVICLRLCSTSVDFSVASFFFLTTLSVALYQKRMENRKLLLYCVVFIVKCPHSQTVLSPTECHKQTSRDGSAFEVRFGSYSRVCTASCFKA